MQETDFWYQPLLRQDRRYSRDILDMPANAVPSMGLRGEGL
jgi:hypothetical protein